MSTTTVIRSPGVPSSPQSQQDGPEATDSSKPSQIDPELGGLWIGDAHDICVAWTDHHVEEEFADQMGISVSKLDVRTGRGEGDTGPPRFIIPVDRDLMRQTVDAAKSAQKHRIRPIPDREYNEEWLKEGLGPFEEPRFDDAWDRNNEARWTEMSFAGYCPTPFGPWSKAGGQLNRGHYSQGIWSPGRSPWYAGTTIFPLDETVPHTVVTVKADEPFLADDEGGLLRSGELGAGLAMIRLQMMQPELRGCRYIPVTVFSFVWRHVRAVQIWHDRETPDRIHVRVSDTFDFTTGERGPKWDDWVDLLCLMLGTPVVAQDEKKS